MGSGRHSATWVTVLTSLLSLGGCSSGGGVGSETGVPEDSLEPGATFSAADVDHLLMRAEFGIDEDGRAEARAMGLAAYVDQMLDFPTTGTSAVEADAASLLVNPGDPPGLEGKFPTTAHISDWWLHLMLHSEQPFQERLALFWHDHFAISYMALRPEERYMAVDYIEKLRRQGIGNFKTLVLDLARDPAMLQWLDGSSNVRTEPNENFAREFFELFTAGADRGYTETDIQEAARAFTGYRNLLDGATNLRYHEFDAERKDVGAKVLFTNVILHTNIATVDDFDLAVDATFEHLDVASWLAEKLLLEFVTDAPSASLISNLAAVIRSNDYEIKPILRTLFLSTAFHERKREMVRMPIDYGIGLVRTTRLMVEPDTMRTALRALGQLPGDPPSVFGWPQGDQWLSAAGMIGRANLTRALIIERVFQHNNGYVVPMPPGTPDAAAVVDHLAELMAIRLSAAERATLIDYLDSNVLGNGSVQPDPFDPDDTQDVYNRVRGLIYILANHPDALRR